MIIIVAYKWWLCMKGQDKLYYNSNIYILLCSHRNNTFRANTNRNVIKKRLEKI